MSDIVSSSKKKVNLFDRVIQSVVIAINMNKMNKAIDEHLSVIHRTEGNDKRIYQENILREIVFVKYQYDIMQREMYELKMSYPIEIISKINSTDKTERLELQKIFLEMEYDRVTKTKFKSREDVKFGLLAISSAIDAVKQNIKDEGKSQKYNRVIKLAEDSEIKIQTEEYDEELYKNLFDAIDEYVSYINDNYDISKLPTDERELIEFVIETMIKGIESDIDRHMYEYNLIINICKNSYRYFKVIDKVFTKLQNIYDESLEKEIMSIKDYLRMYREIYDMKIKTQVSDVHRTIAIEDEYLEYSKLVASDEIEKLDEFITNSASHSTNSEKSKKMLLASIESEEIESEEMIIEDIDLEDKQEEEEIQEEPTKNKKKVSKIKIKLTKSTKAVKEKKVKSKTKEKKVE